MSTVASNQIRADLETMIGGTDAAAILGVSPWKSAYEVWARLTGRYSPPDIGNEPRVRTGILLESTIANEYARLTGRSVRRHEAAIRHPQFPFIGGHLDCWTTYDDGDEGVLEVKATGYRKAAWTEELPIQYQFQLQHYLLLTGKRRGSFAVFFGADLEFGWMDVERNDRFCDALLKREVAFWNDYVLTDTPPPTDGSDSCKRVLDALYPADNGEIVSLPIDAIEWDGDLCDLKEQRKKIDAEIADRENKIKAALGDATRGVLPDGVFYNYKLQKRDAYTVKATEFRVLRRGERK